ncbi:hypothetical protein [Paenibacillus caui]|uniref:hypothetical protein n=1 Tax=Paenibacillus caui TaxID=2873927 RepID=UPI001CA8F3F1|nr:hypothetical protein [Paenibacillus caui]
MGLIPVGIKWDISLLLKLLGWSLLLALLSVLRFYPSSASLEDLMISAYGTIDVYAVQTVIPVFMWILPFLVSNFNFGEHIAKQLDRHAVYLFTRTARRKSWLVKQAMYLSHYVIVFQLLLQGSTVLLGYISGLKAASLFTLWEVTIGITALLSLSGILLVLTINFLSLSLSAVVSSVLVLSYQLIALFTAGSLLRVSTAYYTQLKWMPLTQGVYGWQASIFTGTEKVKSYLGDGVRFAGCYMIVAIIVVLLIGLRKINRLDIY